MIKTIIDTPTIFVSKILILTNSDVLKNYVNVKKTELNTEQ